jgi:ribose transport system permease protein
VSDKNQTEGLAPARSEAAVPASRSAAGEPPAAARAARSVDPFDLLERFGLLLLFVVVVVVFSLWKPETFATGANFRAIATSQSVVAVTALALMFPLIGGRFDLSVGGILGLTAIASADAMSSYGYALVPAIAVGVAFGAVVGLANGLVVARLGVNSIIGTLGTSTILGGLVIAHTEGDPISEGLSTTLTDLGSKTVAGVPEISLVMLVISVVAWFILTQTPYGRRLAAVGVNLRAADLTGVQTRRVVALSFVASGVLSGLAGVMQVAAQGNGDPSVGGLTFILPAVAAVFLGATTWRPGRFNVPGTILALFFVGTTISGLQLAGADPWVTDVFNGAAIVIAIALSAQFRRRRTGELPIGD